MAMVDQRYITASLQNASVSIAGKQVLKNISMTVDQAEIVVVLGENGAGKSSLLSAMAGLLPLDQGRRRLTEADGQDAAITRVGYVLQKPVLFRRSIAGNIDYAMDAAGIDQRLWPEYRRDVLKLMNITQDERRSAFHLSQGERQRLAVARVLAMKPGILMLDEASNSLDKTTVSLLESHVRHLADQGMPVIWVTHSLEQARRIADRIITIHDGEITKDCRVEAFF